MQQTASAGNSRSMRTTPSDLAGCQAAALTVDLLTVDALDVDDPLLTVHLCDLALTALQHRQQQRQR